MTAAPEPQAEQREREKRREGSEESVERGMNTTTFSPPTSAKGTRSDLFRIVPFFEQRKFATLPVKVTPDE